MSETLIARIVGYHTANDPSTVLSIPITGIHAIPDNGYLGDGDNAGASEMVDSRGQPLPSFTNELLIVISIRKLWRIAYKYLKLNFEHF